MVEDLSGKNISSDKIRLLLIPTADDIDILVDDGPEKPWKQESTFGEEPSSPDMKEKRRRLEPDSSSMAELSFSFGALVTAGAPTISR